VVGHQPTLGHVAALLLSGTPAEWAVKKGAIFWLTHRLRGEQSQVVLRAALSPELL
jgi:phosphohistidine phosphatase